MIDWPSNDLIDPDLGSNATYWYNGNSTIGSPYYRTEVGAHENSESLYGTFDQAGNAWEWNEAILFGSYRGRPGGSFDEVLSLLHASARSKGAHTFGGSIGFRVAEVAEPATIALLAFGGVMVLGK